MTASKQIGPVLKDEDEKSCDESRITHATQVQRSAMSIIDEMRRSPYCSSEWSLPITVIPAVCAVMATTLVAGTKDCVQGITLKSSKADSGSAIKLEPTLPANLQKCRDLGGDALKNAEKLMKEVYDGVLFAGGPSGLVVTIVGLLNDPKQAKKELIPALEHLKRIALQYKESTEEMQAEIAGWVDFIRALELALIEQQGETVNEGRGNEKEQSLAKVILQKTEVEEKEAKKNVQVAEKQLENAKEAVDTAQKLVEQLLHPPEPMSLEKIKDMLSSAKPSKKWRGVFTWLSDLIVGQSDEDKDRDMRRDQEYMDAEAKRIMDIYETRCAAARETLKQALENEKEVSCRLAEERKTLCDSESRLTMLDARMKDASEALERLGREKVQLDDIKHILKVSIGQLNELKTYVDELGDFFVDLSLLVHSTVDHWISDFLRTIEAGVQFQGDQNPRIIGEVELGEQATTRLLSAMLKIQARLSAMRDISQIYIEISKQYIMPGIRKMDRLSSADDEYQSKRIEFDEWCKTSKQEIVRKAEARSEALHQNIIDSVNIVTQKAMDS